MLLLNPASVTLGSTTLSSILSISIDRTPNRQLEEWSDLGPYPVLVDVPEQKIRIRIIQELLQDSIEAPAPGTLDELTFFTAPAQSDAGRRKVTTLAVVLECSHEISLKSARRIITLAAISGGAADPITITDPGA